ncbi:MAG TPA: hypothetical protein VFS43_05055 [Polyangiaceae bacterium]|nr:hypothetical protein [Polyangiaceae bacterium]
MRRTTALLGLLALSLSACGGAAAPQAPGSPADGAPSSLKTSDDSYASVDEAEQGLRRAQTELHSALGTAPAGDAAGGAPPPPAAEPAAPPPPGPARPPAPPAPKREAQAQEAAPCATACRAFTSMTKAADTICRLAGPSDERCTKAQRSIEEARSSLRTCVCVVAP